MELNRLDTHHLSAAQGWLELGNHVEADADLNRITAAMRAHPDVLELRWQIYAKAGKWEACVEIGTALVRTAAKRPESWRRPASAPRNTRRHLDRQLGIAPHNARLGEV